MGYGPFASPAALREWMEKSCLGADPLFHAVVDRRSNKALGVASYLRIDPPIGVIEVGHIHFSPALQGTPMATETMYLMMARAFDELGYRRYEWKCNALNAASRKAALRLGLRFRSEEHTSELQSLMRISYAGFCLQKKNNTHLPPTYS